MIEGRARLDVSLLGIGSDSWSQVRGKMRQTLPDVLSFTGLGENGLLGEDAQTE